MKDIKTKKCGCLFFKVGDPVLCERHAARLARRAAKEKVVEEKGLRKEVVEAAAMLGHYLKRFEEYGAAGQPGKWTTYCQNCGDIVIVYDDLKHVPGDSDQVIGAPLTQQCRRSVLMSALKEIE
jgi:hypothetical protein